MKTGLLILSTLVLSSCAGLQSRFHWVSKGDTFQGIASLYQVPVAELRSYNEESLSLGLRPGMKLYIPFEENPSWNIPERVERTELAEGEIEPSRKPASAVSDEMPLMRYIWPVSGNLSSKFGKRRGSFHEGIDIAAPRGTPVRSSRPGHVIYAHNAISGYGNLIIIRHSDGFATVYAHLSSMAVKKGQFVARGQRIGKVGATGHARGPHLHFEIRKGQIPIDPLQYLGGAMLASHR